MPSAAVIAHAKRFHLAARGFEFPMELCRSERHRWCRHSEEAWIRHLRYNADRYPEFPGPTELLRFMYSALLSDPVPALEDRTV